MRRFILSLVVLFVTTASLAQQARVVNGSVVDTTEGPLENATINLKSASENLTTTTNASGAFHFAKVSAHEFVITITSVGFQDFSQAYTVSGKDGKTFSIQPIKLKMKLDELSEVIIEKNPITIKEDTVEYRAGAYKVREGAPVEDVIKKLPGVTVDKDGNVTAQGQAVKRIRVNGKDYFGGDVQTATQNLPADIIDNIQIIDDYGDKANVTGIKEGEPEKILNINIQKGKSKGNFGNATVGAGNKERYMGRISANNFKEDRQVSLLASINNTNGNAFNFNGGGRGGGARGANFGSGERGGSGGDGNTVTKSIGFNYRDAWGDKITSYGSYSFSGRSNSTTGSSYRQDLNPANIRTTSSSGNNSNESANHRVTWNVEYRPDTNNYIKITPYFSYASSNGSNAGLSNITAKRNDTSYYTLNKSGSHNNSTAPSAGSDLFYNHKFKKRGRNFSISSSIDYSSRLQNRDAQNEYHDSTSISLLATDSLRHQFIKTNAENTNTSIRFSYAEPLGKSTSLEASYSWNNSSTKSIRDADDINFVTGEKIRNIPQSNDYEYRYITNRYGLSLNRREEKYNVSLGIEAQPSLLTGIDNGRKITTNSRNLKFAPRARFAYNFARRNSLTLTYGGAGREPNFEQLQPVADSSNSKNIVIGNPNLKAEFTNRLRLQYNKVGLLSGTSLFANLSFDQTQNKIVRSSVNASEGTGRTTSYLNTNGFYGLNGNVSFTKPFNDRKFTATINASGNFDNNISFTDSKRNTGQNCVVSPSARFRIDFTDIIDVDINGSYTINKTVTQYTTYTRSTEVRSLNFGINGKNYFFKDWTLGYDFTKIINTGYISTVNSNPVLLNLYVERRFLKRNMGTLRLQGFDLFNQSTGISRTVNGTTITDVQNERLGRYFLLSFNLRLQKFGGKRFQRTPGQRNPDRILGEMRGGGGNRGGGRSNN
ncbi:MAG TPA: TonB-dependent receptor [Hanamia sp.]|nr:TonB-dependent receptor [Hanamia sp.]